MNDKKREKLRNKYKEFVSELNKYYPTEGLLPTLEEMSITEISIYIKLTFRNPKNYRDTVENLLQINCVVIEEKKFDEMFENVFIPFMCWFKSNVKYIQ